MGFNIVKNADGKYILQKANEALTKWNEEIAPQTFAKITNIPSSALLGAYQEKDKTGIPAVGAVRGIVRGLTDPNYYAGEEIRKEMIKSGFNPAVAGAVGLGTEVLIPGIGGAETKAIKKAGDLTDPAMNLLKRLDNIPKGKLLDRYDDFKKVLTRIPEIADQSKLGQRIGPLMVKLTNENMSTPLLNQLDNFIFDSKNVLSKLSNTPKYAVKMTNGSPTVTATRGARGLFTGSTSNNIKQANKIINTADSPNLRINPNRAKNAIYSNDMTGMDMIEGIKNKVFNYDSVPFDILDVKVNGKWKKLLDYNDDNTQKYLEDIYGNSIKTQHGEIVQTSPWFITKNGKTLYSDMEHSDMIPDYWKLLDKGLVRIRPQGNDIAVELSNTPNVNQLKQIEKLSNKPNAKIYMDISDKSGQILASDTFDSFKEFVNNILDIDISKLKPVAMQRSKLISDFIRKMK